jgi:hypothetical protein
MERLGQRLESGIELTGSSVRVTEGHKREDELRRVRGFSGRDDTALANDEGAISLTNRTEQGGERS